MSCVVCRTRESNEIENYSEGALIIYRSTFFRQEGLARVSFQNDLFGNNLVHAKLLRKFFLFSCLNI